MDENPHNDPPNAKKGVLRIVLVGIVGIAIATPVAALVGHFLFGEPFDLASHLHIGITMGAVLAAMEWQRQTRQPCRSCD